jgi:hypothetical protein
LTAIAVRRTRLHKWIRGPLEYLFVISLSPF